MIKPRPSFIQSLGFTMIELLIVISILGFLAVAVLAAINPIEQINRGKDTGSRSDAEQLVSAIDRYYSSNGFYPWVTSATAVNNGTSATGGVAAASAVMVPFSNTAPPTDGTCRWDEKLTQGTVTCTGSDELKATFTTRVLDTAYNTLNVFNRGTQGDSTYVCFIPKSRQFLTEANTRCVDENGAGLPADLQAVGDVVCAGAGAGTGQTLTCLP